MTSEQKQLNKLRREWEAWHFSLFNSTDFAADFRRMVFADLIGPVAPDGKPWPVHDAKTCDVCVRVARNAIAKAESP